MEDLTIPRTNEGLFQSQFQVQTCDLGILLTETVAQNRFYQLGDQSWLWLTGGTNPFKAITKIDGKTLQASLDQIIKTATLGVIDALRSNSQSFCRDHHQERHFVLNVAQAHSGWVVNGQVDSEIWKLIKAPAMALWPGGSDFIEREKTKNLVDYYSNKFGEAVLVFLIPDAPLTRNWGVYLVLASDLRKDPETLLKESINIPEKESLARAMKKAAYLLTTGDF